MNHPNSQHLLHSSPASWSFFPSSGSPESFRFWRANSSKTKFSSWKLKQSRERFDRGMLSAAYGEIASKARWVVFLLRQRNQPTFSCRMEPGTKPFCSQLFMSNLFNKHKEEKMKEPTEQTHMPSITKCVYVCTRICAHAGVCVYAPASVCTSHSTR